MTSTLINCCCRVLFFLTPMLVCAQSMDLRLNWEFAQSGSESWNKAEIPGCVFTDLMRINAIPDPFIGANEDSVKWVSSSNWTYRTAFFTIDSASLNAQELWLRFSQLEAPCEIYFNTKRILTADNAFRTWQTDVKSLAKSTGNRIEIRFKSPVNEATLRAKKYGFLPTGEARVFVRKAPYQFGWDWGPALPGAGIGALPQLLAVNTFKLLDAAVHTVSLTPESAQMEMLIKIYSPKSIGSSIILNFDGNPEDYYKIYLEKGTHIYRYRFSVKDPNLWWCHDQGDPYLYNYSLIVKGRGHEEKKQGKFGVRIIELINEKDAAPDSGTSFGFRLNGRDIFAKGANYIPQDVFTHRVDDSDYRNLLQDAVNSNMNMLRVWGGGIYEKDIFYDLCDSLGLLIWQDYMFACAMYPGDKKFLENVKLEAEEQSLRIGAHPCVALFCGNNEIAEGWARWGWKDPLKKSQVKKLDDAYQRIFEEILRNTTTTNTQCDYWPSSPMLGRGDPLHTSRGDAHYWGVWHDAEPFENFRIKVPRFMSEFGFQSYPSMKTLTTAVELEDQLYVGNEYLGNHQKHTRGDKLISDYMDRWLDKPENFKDFVYYSQFVQAEGMRIGIDAHLAAWPYCTGTLYWQLNDCWPAISWSSREYNGNWKMMHYMVQEAFKPLRLVVKPVDENNIQVFVHNLTPQGHKVNFTAQFMDADEQFSFEDEELKTVFCEAGKNTLIGEFPLDRSPNAAKPHFWVFAMQSEGGDDRRIHLVNDLRSYLSNDNDFIFNLEKEGDVRRIKIAARAFEMGIWIECEAEGVFSHNYFDLLAGEEREIRFESKEQNLNFKISTLNSGVIKYLDEKELMGQER